MNDEQIIEYLRSRGRAEPPLDLVDSVMNAIAKAPPRRASWFTPVFPVVAAAGAAAVIIAVAVLLSQRPNVGPVQLVSPAASPSAQASAAPSATPDRLAVLDPGDTVQVPAVDTGGQWGTIRVQRGDDLGGYQDVATAPDSFVIQVFVHYAVDRLPDPEQFGASDWSLRSADPDAEHFFGTDPAAFAPEPTLGIYPGAVDVLSTPPEGWIVFEVPRRKANLALELVYSPAGFDEPAATITARRPGPPPEPVAFVTPPPARGTPVYVKKEGLPFTVIDSAEADALFANPDTCTNPVDRYTVTFPDDWYTNTDVGDTPACSWFTPEFFEVDDPTQAPDEIWIGMGVIDAAIGYTGVTEIDLNDDVLVGGLPAHRVEFNADPNANPANRRYHYVIPLAEDPAERTFVATTDTDWADDYHLARAALDRMMASLTFER